MRYSQPIRAERQRVAHTTAVPRHVEPRMPREAPTDTAELLALQRTAGNHAVQRLLGGHEAGSALPARGGLIMRKIFGSALNIVGENHEVSDKRRKREQAMLDERYSIPNDAYWVENEFAYDTTGTEQLGDSPSLRLAHNAAIMLEHLEVGVKRAATATERCNELAKNLESGGVGAVKTALRRFNAEFELRESVDFLIELARRLDDEIQSQSRKTPAAPNIVVDTLNVVTPHLFACQDLAEKLSESIVAVLVARSHDNAVEDLQASLRTTPTQLFNFLAQCKISVVKLLRALNYEHYKTRDVGALQDDISLERSRHMLQAAVASKKRLGVWKVGDHHVQDMKNSNLKKSAVSLTPMDEFEAEFKEWESGSQNVTD
jgi:hypothetical protein